MSPSIRPFTTAQAPWLHEEVGRRMAERLVWIKRTPEVWLDWSPLRGGLAAHAAVQAHYPLAQAWLDGPGSELALRTLAPARAWNPFRKSLRVGLAPSGGQVQMLWSNMALHAEPDPAGRLAAWQARLAIDGFLMFSCLGPDTLRELRGLHARQGWPEPSAPLVDMHDWGDRLVGAGFAEPVMDMERIVLSYSSADALLAELRELGRNQHPGRFAGLRSRAWGREYRAVLEREMPRDGEGRLLLSFEVVYGHAFKPLPRIRPGEASAISLQEMRSMLRGSRPD